MRRTHDLVPQPDPDLRVTIDRQPVSAYAGETVLSVLFAHGRQAFSYKSCGRAAGAYCGMGVCYCCLVTIDGLDKQRACQVGIRDGMEIETGREA